MTEANSYFLTIDFNNASRLTFVSLAEAESWVSELRKFWRWLSKANTQEAGNQIHSFREDFSQNLNTISARLEELKKDPDDLRKRQVLHNAIQGPVNNGKLLLPAHPFSAIASDIAQNFGPTAGLAALAVLLKIPLQNGPIIQGIIEATLLRDGASQRSPQLLEKFLGETVANNQPRIEKAIDAITAKTAEASSVCDLQDRS